MEIIEQLRFIFIIFMAFLSYRHISNQPLAICQSDSEDEDIILDEGDECIAPEAVVDEPICVEEELPAVSVNEAENPFTSEGIEVQLDDQVSIIIIENQENVVNCQNEQSDVLGERVNQEEENVTDKVEKTKPIKRTWKRAKKFSEKTEATLTMNQQNEAQNRVQMI